MKNIHITEEEYQEIEDFLSGNMPPEKTESFAHRVDNDQEWREKVRMVKLTTTAIREKALEGELKRIHLRESSRSGFSGRKKSRVILFTLLAAAAIITFFLVSPIVTHLFISDNERLFSQYYQPEAGLITAMGVSETYEFDRGMIDYKMGKYEEANRRWLELLKDNKNSDTLNYFIGSGYLAMGKAAQSVDFFKVVLQTKESAFYNDANWYLGLALLDMGRKEEAVQYIAASDNEQKEKLLSDLHAQ